HNFLLIGTEEMNMPRGRPRIHDEQAVLDATLAVLWRQGIHGISLNQLSEETGIPKPVLSNTVGCKDELIARALEHYRERYRDAVSEALSSAESLSELVRNYLSIFADLQTEPNSPGGCFMASANADCAHMTSGPIRDTLDRINTESAAELSDALMRLAVDDPNTIARYISGQALAMASQSRMGASREALEVFIVLAEKALAS
ncbi:MAG: hypothetical protein AAGH65_03750, partial [Pseudomonadota bacterium]